MVKRITLVLMTTLGWAACENTKGEQGAALPPQPSEPAVAIPTAQKLIPEVLRGDIEYLRDFYAGNIYVARPYEDRTIGVCALVDGKIDCDTEGGM